MSNEVKMIIHHDNQENMEAIALQLRTITKSSDNARIFDWMIKRGWSKVTEGDYSREFAWKELRNLMRGIFMNCKVQDVCDDPSISAQIIAWDSQDGLDPNYPIDTADLVTPTGQVIHFPGSQNFCTPEVLARGVAFDKAWIVTSCLRVNVADAGKREQVKRSLVYNYIQRQTALNNGIKAWDNTEKFKGYPIFQALEEMESVGLLRIVSQRSAPKSDKYVERIWTVKIPQPPAKAS